MVMLFQFPDSELDWFLCTPLIFQGKNRNADL